jgi:zinc protease
MAGKAEQIGFYETVIGDPCAAFRRLEAYRRATASDLRKVARRCLDPRQRTVVIVHPAPTETAAAQ